MIIEKWNEEIKGKRIVIDQNICKNAPKTTIGSIWYTSAFGVNIIDSGCFQWVFKINSIYSISKSLAMLIGIVDHLKYNEKIEIYFTTKGDGFGWFLSADDSPLVSKDSQESQYGKQVKEGDVVKMIFNFDKQFLKYIVNDHDYGIAKFEREIDQNKKYKMAVTFFGHRNEVELISGSYINASD